MLPLPELAALVVASLSRQNDSARDYAAVPVAVLAAVPPLHAYLSACC